jgi:hypothetical protein
MADWLLNLPLLWMAVRARHLHQLNGGGKNILMKASLGRWGRVASPLGCNLVGTRRIFCFTLEGVANGP